MADVQQISSIIRSIIILVAVILIYSNTGGGRRWRSIHIATPSLIMKLVSFAQVRTNSISIIITSINIELLLALHSYPGILTRSHTAICLHIFCLVVITTMMMQVSLIRICQLPIMV